MKALGIVFSNIHDKYVSELTRSRTMASVPYGGRYRLIDFVLSNMVNSGITKVGVITKSNYQSLMDHIGSGKDWDLSRKNAGVILLPPYGAVDSNSLYKTRLEALKGILGFLTKQSEDYVVMTDSDKVQNADYADVLDRHEQQNADITVVYKHGNVSKSTAQQSIIYHVDKKTSRILDVMVYPDVRGMQDYCLNIFVLKRQLLIDLVVDAMSNGYTSFHRNILQPNCDTLKILGYRFEGYSATVDSLAGYYRCNMDLLDRKVLDDLFGNPERPVYTKVRDSAPTRYDAGSRVRHSLVADGCEIYGEVEDSILFRGVKISPGAKVKGCILMQDTIVSEHADLNCVITDKNVVIRDRRVLSGCPDLPFFIGKNMRV